MRIEEIDLNTVLTRLAQARPELKDEMGAIAQAEQTFKAQNMKTRKPAQQVRVDRSEALTFYEAIRNDMVTAYHISDIREGDVFTILQAEIQGMRRIRPIALLLSIPQEGFQMPADALQRIEDAAVLCYKIIAPRGRGLEVFMGIYQQQVSDSLLRWEFF